MDENGSFEVFVKRLHEEYSKPMKWGGLANILRNSKGGRRSNNLEQNIEYAKQFWLISALRMVQVQPRNLKISSEARKQDLEHNSNYFVTYDILKRAEVYRKDEGGPPSATYNGLIIVNDNPIVIDIKLSKWQDKRHRGIVKTRGIRSFLDGEVWVPRLEYAGGGIKKAGQADCDYT